NQAKSHARAIKSGNAARHTRIEQHTRLRLRRNGRLRGYVARTAKVFGKRRANRGLDHQGGERHQRHAVTCSSSEPRASRLSVAASQMRAASFSVMKLRCCQAARDCAKSVR